MKVRGYDPKEERLSRYEISIDHTSVISDLIEPDSFIPVSFRILKVALGARLHLDSNLSITIPNLTRAI